MWASLIDDVDLGAAVETEIQPSGPDRTRAELRVDVADVRPGYNGEVHPLGAQLFDGTANLGSIGAAVRHGGAIPVEDDGLEATVQRGRNRLRLDDPWSAAQRRSCDGHDPPVSAKASTMSRTERTPTARCNSGPSTTTACVVSCSCMQRVACDNVSSLTRMAAGFAIS